MRWTDVPPWTCGGAPGAIVKVVFARQVPTIGMSRAWPIDGVIAACHWAIISASLIAFGARFGAAMALGFGFVAVVAFVLACGFGFAAGLGRAAFFFFTAIVVPPAESMNVGRRKCKLSTVYSSRTRATIAPRRETAQPGVYAYLIEYVDPLGEKKKLKGQCTLIR